MKKFLVTVALAVLASSNALWAQLQTGNLHGTVRDDQGNPLPAVTLTLTGAGAPQVQTSNAEGEFRFLGLSPGSYALQAELEAFSTVSYPNVTINIGRNTSIELTLNAAVEDVITVTAESPLLDERRIATGNTVSQTELEKIPTARDPWAVLQSTPGVLTDRINVGGNESGQQSQYVGPGSAGDQAVWSVDGVVITDMAALGSSPAYYDFDSFEEMQVTTGGSDSTIATGGVVLNMVTKRGTNEWRGTGRYLKSDDDWQSSLELDDSDLGQAFPGNSGAGFPTGRAQPPFKAGNRIVSVEDYGAEIGGPIVKDRLWVWGSYGLQEVDLLTVSDASDYTELETTNLKLNAQISSNNSATVTALNSDKVKIGRNAGPFRRQETTWNQSKFGDDPTAAKIEDTHIFSPNFYVTGLYSIVNGGFQLAPQGGTERVAYLDPALVWHNTFLLYQTERPQEQIKADASNFFSTGNLSHELKYGAGLRSAEVASLSRWGGAGHITDGALIGAADGLHLLYLMRDAFPAATNDYTSLYVQDTMALGNLTANLGLRYDLQEGENEARNVRANPVVPNLMPAASYGGGPAGFEWESIVPRLGLTYALGPERKTLLRASYSRFADQLGITPTFWLNPLTTYSYHYLYVDTTGPTVGVNNILDLNGNGTIDVGDTIGFPSATNPFTNGLLLNNEVDPNLDPPTTDELLLSVEHALLPEFVVGLNLTYRQITDILEPELLVFDCGGTDQTCPYSASNISRFGRPHRRDDYVRVAVDRPSGLPDGSSYTREFWQLRPGVASRGGFLLENGDREQEYMGASITFNKRLANRWMLRGNVSMSDWEWQVPGSEEEDPTRILPGNQDGEPVMQGSGTGSGSKGAVYINSNWSYSLNGLYQIAPDRPWGFNVALNAAGREGYPIPYFERLGFNARAGIPTGFTRVQVVDNEDFRLDDVHILDARVEKEFAFNEFGLTVGVDVFNLFNESTILQRNHRLRAALTPALIAGNPNAPFGDYVTETTSPRIFRVGARLSFR